MEAGTAAAPKVATRSRAKAKTIKTPRTKTPWWMWVAVAAIVVFCLFPFYWLINISLKTGNDLLSSSLFPPNPTLKNYSAVFHNPDFTKALRNSAVVASRPRCSRCRSGRSALTRSRAWRCAGSS